MDVGKIGDKVVCNCKGGPHSIVTGATTVFVDNVPMARVGDRTSCGATITTGLAWYLVEDAPVAINGSTTSCGGYIVTDSTAVTSAPATISLGDGIRFRQVDDPQAELQAEIDRINEATLRAREGDESSAKASGIEPGFHVVRSPGTRDEIKQRLFGSPRPDVDAMFERLNRHLGDYYVLPGSLVVLSDPDNKQCTAEEEALQSQAYLARAVIQTLEPDQAQAIINSWGAIAELEQASQVTGDTSTWGGTAVSGLSNLKQASAETLNELAQIADESADYVKTRGQTTFRRLGDIATAWINHPFDLPDTAQSLKQAIGVQVDQTVHTIRQAAEGFPAFRVPTVSDAIRSAGRIVKSLNYTNYLMVGLDYTATRLEVERGCCLAAGPEECRRVALLEYGGLTG
ncbi:PAAR domain-containing protein [Aidingimonas halophila]|uniref:Zn-binding Pro-Ala-Ala-Arg (PAAR) domain-containing protein, incolved in TypeVI secretion n=1 Tax=Aidingimonas halophila TaxID=574349 RepID=A0A1H2SG07_9GAMM|nr:PAAR domain-containing protein [Aidingimonas halophila]GHC17689.1 hypothetical protein GCM10008094_04220 [Aidingimonas halophila]SDW30445.1 Zn-binding Pro-Ala-Ala-Arg (PAAR) domain-containing protein, incolved in TypeVI secretion [Aidingimonas halophila]